MLGRAAVLGVLALLLGPAAGRVNKLTLDKDSRFVFSIETFGFVQGGVAEISVRGASLPGSRYAGFFLRKSTSEADVAQTIEEIVEEDACVLSDAYVDGVKALTLVRESAPTGNSSARWVITDPGLYEVGFTNCHPGAPPSSSLTATLKMWNPGPTFLSIGEAPLPTVFAVSAAVFTALAGAWVLALRAGRPVLVHHLMLSLLAFKALAAACEAFMYAGLASTGHNTGWNAVWYVANFFKGMLTFTVILVVGTGYSLLKPALNDREKTVVALVLALQVLANVAVVVVWEGQPGSLITGTWTDALHLLDIACCCAVLFPIAWSLKNLTAAAAADGKAAATAARLRQFRAFYVYVMLYIYLSRIIVFILASTLPFTATWVAHACAEAFAAVFYVAVGAKFRPAVDNPYLRLPTQEEDDGEFGLSDGDEPDAAGPTRVGGTQGPIGGV